MGTYRILAVGDVVGRQGTAFIADRLFRIRAETRADFVVLNCENAAVGNGVDPETARTLLSSGADLLTGGNHSFQKRSIYDFLDNEPRILRPANYPASCPGQGYTVVPLGALRLLAMNVMGTVFTDSLASPFETADGILARMAGAYDVALLDIHAEATAEKIALARYLDGRVQILFGTHTHVQTADERVLPNGAGYITDLGMTGPEDSVLGVRTDCIIERFRTKMPVRFEDGEGPCVLHGAVFCYDDAQNRVTAVERVAIS